MSAATWPSILAIVNAGVPEQYCWSIFVLVSAAVQNTWGGFNPITWGEALVWTFAMVTVAVLFAVMVGFIIGAIKSSSRANSGYKDNMDAIVVRLGLCQHQKLLASAQCCDAKHQRTLWL